MCFWGQSTLWMTMLFNPLFLFFYDWFSVYPKKIRCLCDAYNSTRPRLRYCRYCSIVLVVPYRPPSSLPDWSHSHESLCTPRTETITTPLRIGFTAAKRIPQKNSSAEIYRRFVLAARNFFFVRPQVNRTAHSRE